MDTLKAHITSFIIMAVVAMFPSDVMKATKSRWYQCIRPSITPPNIVFPVVWTVLYILIAFALAQTFMVRGEENKNKKFPPPPPFIYDEKNMYGIRKLILSSKIPEKPPKNPITRAIIKEVYLYKAKVPNSEESGKKGGRRKTNKRRGKTNKKRGKTLKKRVKNNNNIKKPKNVSYNGRFE